MTIYRLEGITKLYGEKRALDDVSFKIEEREILGIIGQSGAGKTTLLRIMAGLEAPTYGEMAYNRRRVEFGEAHWLRKRVSMIFQKSLFLKGDVYTNLAYGLRLRKTPESRIDERISEILKTVRLEDFQHREAKSLSGGEQQRAALARALVLDPEVLLLDEPTSNLDPANTKVISSIILKESQNRCIVLATHDFSQIRSLTDRIITLENGRLTEQGISSEIYSLSRLSENIFTGEARMENEVTLIDTGKVTITSAQETEGKVTIHIRPQDIIVSKEPIESSACNTFEGQITGIQEEDGIVKLQVNAGENFLVQITRLSYREMALNVGTKIHINFKASSIFHI